MTSAAGLRRARLADVPRLAEVEASAFPSPWSARQLTGEIGHPASLVLVAVGDDDRPSGYAAFRRAADEAELVRVAVAPAERRRGVGRRLVEAGLALVARAGAASCHLEVSETNTAALALYERLGFRPSGRRPGYYADGADAILMTRPIGTS